MDDVRVVRLPAELVAEVDAVARAELRSRSNATRWLLERALRDREPAGAQEDGVESR
jgi:metal-responsive CopG/Arc/MetJ family transcriptional regulator